MKLLLLAIRSSWRRCRFRLQSLNQKPFKRDENEGAGKIILLEERRLQCCAVFSNIVDVDDKNCLAVSTVALKSNQGVRQWLYIIGGALFFVTFFCASKRK